MQASPLPWRQFRGAMATEQFRIIDHCRTAIGQSAYKHLLTITCRYCSAQTRRYAVKTRYQGLREVAETIMADHRCSNPQNIS